MKDYRKLTIGLIVVWFLFSLSASALGVFANAANRLGGAVAIGALTPILLFLIWFGASNGFRRFMMSLNPRILTTLQAGRIVGFTFLLLEAHRLLPSIFAWPAGYGDMWIGATACFVAWKVANPEHRKQFILWQVLGIADLVTAVSLGATAPLIHPQGVAMTLMTVLPLSLIPTFLVPLYTILHFICIAQAKIWKADSVGIHPMTTPLQRLAN